MSTRPKDDPNYRPIARALKIVGTLKADQFINSDKVDCVKAAFFYGAIAAQQAIACELNQQLNRELELFTETGCTCGKADCEKIKAKGSTH